MGLIEPARARRACPARGAESTKFSSRDGGRRRRLARADRRAGAGRHRRPACRRRLRDDLLGRRRRAPPRRGHAARPRRAGRPARAARARSCSVQASARTAPRFARDLYARVEVPLVLDADGLNAFAGHPLPDRAGAHRPDAARRRAGRLIDGDVEAHRLACARAGAEHARAILVLKGDDTLVRRRRPAASRSRPAGAPGLATAGTGDVLAGVIAALLARGADPTTRSAPAVYAHVRAGQLAARPTARTA